MVLLHPVSGRSTVPFAGPLVLGGCTLPGCRESGKNLQASNVLLVTRLVPEQVFRLIQVWRLQLLAHALECVG